MRAEIDILVQRRTSDPEDPAVTDKFPAHCSYELQVFAEYGANVEVSLWRCNTGKDCGWPQTIDWKLTPEEAACAAHMLLAGARETSRSGDD